jgi:hypothetical protein
MAVKKKSDTISTLPFKAISVLLELSSSIVAKRRAPKSNSNDTKASNKKRSDRGICGPDDQQRSNWRTPARPKAKIITLEC